MAGSKAAFGVAQKNGWLDMGAWGLGMRLKECSAMRSGNKVTKKEEISNNGTCGLPEGINLMDCANTKSHHHTKLMSMTCIVCT